MDWSSISIGIILLILTFMLSIISIFYFNKRSTNSFTKKADLRATIYCQQYFISRISLLLIISLFILDLIIARSSLLFIYPLVFVCFIIFSRIYSNIFFYSDFILIQNRRTYYDDINLIEFKLHEKEEIFILNIHLDKEDCIYKINASQKDNIIDYLSIKIPNRILLRLTN
ncbi:hypothetical protein ACQPU1_02395 [Clostridium paraputrificum]|uniref:hypothetical protein n=1 Tax=Clostridium TaxID=1485 RepID=UPI003D33874D